MSQVRLLIVFFFSMAAQWWWSTHFSFAGVAPQLLLVMTVAVAARLGSNWAMSCGFFWGLFLDVMSARLFGGNALALTLVGYGTGSVRRQMDVAGLGPQCLLVFSMSWAYYLMIGLLGRIFDPSKTFLWVGWPLFLAGPFYNCLVAIAVYAIWDPRWEQHR